VSLEDQARGVGTAQTNGRWHGPGEIGTDRGTGSGMEVDAEPPARLITGTGAARYRHRDARRPRWSPAEARWDGAPRGRRPAWLRAAAARDGYGTWAAPAWCPALGPPDLATAPPPARGGDRTDARPGGDRTAARPGGDRTAARPGW
jgi:hypothetical protein